MNQSQGVLRLRDACPEELDEVALLIRDAYQEYRVSFPARAWEEYARDIVDVRSRLGASELIVALEAGRILGAVTFYPAGYEGWPPGCAGIRLLAAHPAERGRGIGRALMLECLRRCRDRAVSTVGLHTTEPMVVARKMYERMGFLRASEFDFRPAPGVVVVAYRLDLQASGSPPG